MTPTTPNIDTDLALFGLAWLAVALVLADLRSLALGPVAGMCALACYRLFRMTRE